MNFKFLLIFYFLSIHLLANNDWQIKEQIEPINNSKDIFFILKASDTNDELNKDINLVIKCSSHTNAPDFLIEWNKILPISPKISYRFDGDDIPSEFKWNRSNNGTASIYSNDALNKQSFLNHLSTNKYLYVKTLPYLNNSITATFSIENFKNILEPYKKICKYKTIDEILEAIDEKATKALAR